MDGEGAVRQVRSGMGHPIRFPIKVSNAVQRSDSRRHESPASRIAVVNIAAVQMVAIHGHR